MEQIKITGEFTRKIGYELIQQKLQLRTLGKAFTTTWRSLEYLGYSSIEIYMAIDELIDMIKDSRISNCKSSDLFEGENLLLTANCAYMLSNAGTTIIGILDDRRKKNSTIETEIQLLLEA